jgi:hypothetical protein
MPQPIYVWTDRIDPEWGYWTGWTAGTLQSAAEDALQDAPVGSEAHATRRMGSRTLTLRVAEDGTRIRIKASKRDRKSG